MPLARMHALTGGVSGDVPSLGADVALLAQRTVGATSSIACQLTCGNQGEASLYFGDTDSIPGRITYRHLTNDMVFFTSNIEAMILEANGLAIFKGPVTSDSFRGIADSNAVIIGTSAGQVVISSTGGASGARFKVQDAQSGVLYRFQDSADVAMVTIHSDGGLYMDGATGSSQGSGTINAVGVYDDSVILTDYVFEYFVDGEAVDQTEQAQNFDQKLLDIDYFGDAW